MLVICLLKLGQQCCKSSSGKLGDSELVRYPQQRSQIKGLWLQAGLYFQSTVVCCILWLLFATLPDGSLPASHEWMGWYWGCWRCYGTSWCVVGEWGGCYIPPCPKARPLLTFTGPTHTVGPVQTCWLLQGQDRTFLAWSTWLAYWIKVGQEMFTCPVHDGPPGGLVKLNRQSQLHGQGGNLGD